MVHEYGPARAGDVGCQHQHPGRGQYGISRTDLTQRPCAEGNCGSHEQRGQLTTELAGEWSIQELGEVPDGPVFLRDLEVYMPGDDSPFLWFVEVDSDFFLSTNMTTAGGFSHDLVVTL